MERDGVKLKRGWFLRTTTARGFFARPICIKFMEYESLTKLISGSTWDAASLERVGEVLVQILLRLYQK